jgi:glycosyltransferase involved in cell wall biosynthesis
MNPLISIIIPTRNRCQFLKDAIESIYVNEFSKEKFEVIVVDNNSNDETKKICDSLKTIHKNLFYFFEPRNGLLFGRHKGLEESQGNILIYIDDDVLVTKKWLETFEKIFSGDAQIVLAGGNNLPKYEGKVPEWENSLWKSCSYGRYLSEYSLIDFNSLKQEVAPQFFYGCNFAIRRQFLIDCKGFHPDGFSKENILFRGDGESYISEQVQKLGRKAYFSHEASIYHRIPTERLTEEYLSFRHYSQGISFSYHALRMKKRGSKIAYCLLMLKYSLGKLRAKRIQTIFFRKLRLAFFEGALAHLNAYNDQVAIQNWVHREHYLDGKKLE